MAPENAVQWSFMISASEATLKNMDKLSSGNSCYDHEKQTTTNPVCTLNSLRAEFFIG